MSGPDGNECDVCGVSHPDSLRHQRVEGRSTSRSTVRRLERTPGVGCWECSQKDGHAATGGEHMPFHCKPDLCPDKAKHAEQVYGSRFEKRLTSASRDGVITTLFIDGEKADHKHRVSRCICGLLLIWTPR